MSIVTKCDFCGREMRTSILGGDMIHLQGNPMRGIPSMDMCTRCLRELKDMLKAKANDTVSESED